MSTESPFRVLAVCTGNVCRSPMVEKLLQAGFESLPSHGLEISSAGTGALAGRTMTEQSAGLLRALGANDTNFVARQLTPDLIRHQNLILALTREHRASVLKLAPHMLRRTFTLRQFGRMLTHIANEEDLQATRDFTNRERWEAALTKARAAQYATMAQPPIDDDVVDPFRKSDKVYQEAIQQIVPAVNQIVAYEKKCNALSSGETS